MIQKGKPAVILAPMQELIDPVIRALMGKVGGFSFCVSEFLRISQNVPPESVFLKLCPELATQGRTRTGLPVQLQLLGGDPDKLAAAAALACTLGAPAIDLNFGCPAPTVNRHDGGAALLRYPLRIRQIVEAVRKAVPQAIPVSAKLRLGIDSPEPIHENALRAAEGGANWLVIHGRTKAQGYSASADWKLIGEVRRGLSLPVVANGDIWTLEDFRRCRDESSCEHFMLGRGALANPGLANRIARELGLFTGAYPDFDGSKQHWHGMLMDFAEFAKEYDPWPGYLPGRSKKWLRYAHDRKTAPWYEGVKRANSFEEILTLLAGSEWGADSG